MKTQYEFHTLDVFTQRRFGGNPLAVFPGCRGPRLTSHAADRPRGEPLGDGLRAACRGPARAVQGAYLHAGQRRYRSPVIQRLEPGTCSQLWAASRLREERTTVLFEEGVGLVPVEVRQRDGKPDFVQLSAAKVPEFGPPPPDRVRLAAILGIRPEDILDGVDRPESVSCGVPFLFVPVRDRGVVARAEPDVARWRVTLAHLLGPGIFLFCRDPELPGSDLHARMFAPLLGITEDPATGGACAALGGYLGARATIANGTLRWVIEQGFEMRSPEPAAPRD
mgnify:CR=1 FL=1